MRLLHCADLHLDAKMTTNLTKEKARERKKELLLTFERMVEYAAANDMAAVLIAGDLFDTKNISATARHCVENAIARHPGITFFYLKGNHDRDNFLPGMETLPENLKLFGEEWTTYPLGDGRIAVSGLELSEKNQGRAFHSLVLDAGKFNIVMLHGQTAETGAKERVALIPLRELKNKGIDYLALGHVHRYQEGALDARGAWCYPGCLEGRGFDECGVHGFAVLDVDEKTGACSREFVPFASRTLYTVEVDLSGCGQTQEMAERIEAVLAEYETRNGNVDFAMEAERTRTTNDRALQTEKPMSDGRTQMDTLVLNREDLVKIVLTGALDVECEKDLVYLQKRFEQDYYFLKIEDATTSRVDWDAFRLDESLKGEFVRTVMNAEELSEDERAEVIRYGLWAISGKERI